MIRSVLGVAVSKGASVLDRLDKHYFDDEDEEDDQSRTARLERMVCELEAALQCERAVSAETSAKLASTLSDQRTIDDLVQEYSQLSNEAQSQAECDATKLAAALNRNEELQTKLHVYEAQILSLTDQENSQVMDLVSSGTLSNDGARLFAALRAAKAKQFELELELNDAKRRAVRAISASPKKNIEGVSRLNREEEEADDGSIRVELHAKELDELRRDLESKHAEELERMRKQLQGAKDLATREADAAHRLKEEKQRLESEQNSRADANESERQGLSSLREELEANHAEKMRTERLEAEQKISAAEQRALAAERVADEAKRSRDEVEGRAKLLEARVVELQAASESAAAAAKATAMIEAERTFSARILAIEASRDEMAAKVHVERKRRREAHNKLVEARGNIRVFCRSRPANDCAASFPSDEEIVVKRDAQEQVSFEFDGVFAPGTTQSEVFDSAARDLVVSALDGYSVCIFAYGQTGSGKTHTMTGPVYDRGVNVRAIQLVFETASRGDIKYELEVSILEIYNETLRDLLGGGNERKKLEVTTATGRCEVLGLEKRRVTSVAEVEELIEIGAANRSVGAHDMNEQSSRSHQIVTLHVSSSLSKISSKLHLIDLAGSERVSRTDATGDRLKEAQSINKSLSALGDVIASLSARGNGRSQQHTHIPFRNSKLTFFLQDSLSGNSKALMFVNVSPATDDVPETLCSLKFASRCRDTALGKAKKNAAAVAAFSSPSKSYNMTAASTPLSARSTTSSSSSSRRSFSSPSSSTFSSPRGPFQ